MLNKNEITVCSFRYCNLNDDKLECICSLLSGMESLLSIDLSKNNYLTYKTKDIMKQLIQTTNLENVDLEGTQIKTNPEWIILMALNKINRGAVDVDISNRYVSFFLSFFLR